MGRLTTDEVTQAFLSLQSRAQTALDNVQSSRSVFDKLLGNSQATAHAIESLQDLQAAQIPTWRDVGMQIAINEQDDKVDEWTRIGKSIASNIDGYDHLGEDYTLAHIGEAAVAQTVTQAKDALPAVGVSLAGMVVVIGLVAVAVILVETKGMRA